MLLEVFTCPMRSYPAESPLNGNPRVTGCLGGIVNGFTPLAVLQKSSAKLPCKTELFTNQCDANLTALLLLELLAVQTDDVAV
jgi:hypothetical protein